MSDSGLNIGRCVLVLCIAFTLAACGNNITAVPNPEKGGRPQLTIEPQSGTQDTRIVITGSAFPPQQNVKLTLKWTEDRQDIGEVTTDGSGAFTLEYVIGSQITERNMEATEFDILAISVGDTANASVKYRYVPDTTRPVSNDDSNTPAPTQPLTEVRPKVTLNPAVGAAKTRVEVTVTDFPPDCPLQIRVGVPDSGLATPVITSAHTDAKGSAQVYLEIPAFWEDGRMVVESVLVVFVNAPDDRGNASATFNHLFTPVETDTASVTITETTEVMIPPSSQKATVEATTSENADAIQTAIDFLTSLLRDPTGQSSVVYLSERLRSEITSDWILPTGIGIQPGFISFEVVLISNQDDVAAIQATLSYEMGASVRDFVLVIEDGSWRIDNVTAGSREE